MDYLFKSGPVKKDRYRIGFLDDNQNHDFHIQVMMGIIDASNEFDIDIIRYGYYSSHIAYKFTHHVDMVLDHIEQYELDGLLFLGWTKAGAMYNRGDFLARFGSIPLLSLGTEYDDLPSVYFGGDTYIAEITRHLIQRHGFSRIAFIDHNRTDARKGAYRRVMEQYGIYDPGYCINDTELAAYSLEDRNEKAVRILLDERKLDVQAIISLNMTETGHLLNVLQKRGIRVPGDIAITSYEDGETARYLSPGFTTVNFPWRKLGYTGCKNLVQLLREGKILQSTRLDSGIIYRESCGCLPETVMNLPAGKVRIASYGLDVLTEKEAADMTAALRTLYGDSGMDSGKLLEEFLRACRERDSSVFFSELSRQIRRCWHNPKAGDFLSDLRKLVYPYLLKDVDTLQWAGDMILQAQVYVSESLVSEHGLNMVEASKVDQMLQDVSQSLLMDFRLENITASLEKGLPKLNIPSCFLFISNAVLHGANAEKNPVEGNITENSVLAFRYQNGIREKTSNIPGKLRKQLSEALGEKRMTISFAYLLHVTDEVMGFALFEPGPLDEAIYQMLSTNISTALRGLVLVDRLNDTYSKLVEHARKEGMADIAADILHNIGNILNSISVSMHLMEEGSRSTVLDDLIKACSLLEANMDRLEEFLCNDVKGKKLMQFFLKLGTAASRLQTQLRFNVERLQGKFGAINEAIAAQQNYAGIDMKMDELSVEPVLEDAIKVNLATLEQYGITVERNYTSSFRTVANRAKLFFVIANIISNARDAMADAPGKRTLTISMYDDGEGKCLRFDDTGTGLKEEWLDKVFEYGFTTKQGKYGYGLYNCAVYMTEMGGSIRAEGEGPGKGASFILRFA